MLDEAGQLALIDGLLMFPSCLFLLLRDGLDDATVLRAHLECTYRSARGYGEYILRLRCGVGGALPERLCQGDGSRHWTSEALVASYTIKVEGRRTIDDLCVHIELLQGQVHDHRLEMSKRTGQRVDDAAVLDLMRNVRRHCVGKDMDLLAPDRALLRN